MPVQAVLLHQNASYKKPGMLNANCFNGNDIHQASGAVTVGKNQSGYEVFELALANDLKKLDADISKLADVHERTLAQAVQDARDAVLNVDKRLRSQLESDKQEISGVFDDLSKRIKAIIVSFGGKGSEKPDVLAGTIAKWFSDLQIKIDADLRQTRDNLADELKQSIAAANASLLETMTKADLGMKRLGEESARLDESVQRQTAELAKASRDALDKVSGGRDEIERIKIQIDRSLSEGKECIDRQVGNVARIKEEFEKQDLEAPSRQVEQRMRAELDQVREQNKVLNDQLAGLMRQMKMWNETDRSFFGRIGWVMFGRKSQP